MCGGGGGFQSQKKRQRLGDSDCVITVASKKSNIQNHLIFWQSRIKYTHALRINHRFGLGLSYINHRSLASLTDPLTAHATFPGARAGPYPRGPPCWSAGPPAGLCLGSTVPGGRGWGSAADSGEPTKKYFPDSLSLIDNSSRRGSHRDALLGE